MRSQFRDIGADVSLAKLRTIRIYVVGDVTAPGAYDISSLSTPINALYAAGGPTQRGSLRHLRQYRGKQLVQEIDAYDLLLHGVHTELAHLQSGDTLLVPPIGPEVTIQGMVRRPAIYELAGEKSLSEVLELSGGVLPTGTLRHVDVDRLVAHEKRSMLRLDLPESGDQQGIAKALEDFQIQDGDTVSISPILPYSEKTVYLDGHVFHPGKYPYREGMKVTDLIRSYSDLLPEPSQRHAEIIRLQPPNYMPEVLTFNLGSALEGKDENLVLKPFDTVRVFGRYDFEDAPVITVNGEVRDPGDHVTNGVTRLRDVIYLAGGVTPDAELNDVQVFRKSDDGKLKVLSVNLSGALSGDANANLLLQPKDRVFIQRSQTRVDPPTVQIQGEVARPGKYPMGENMTASDLIRLGGGLRRGADDTQADLARYLSADGTGPGNHQQVDIARALSGVEDADVALHDGDVLTVRQKPGFKDLGAVITVKGEVVHPGTFGIREGERLSSVLARAGGLRSSAYPYGAILERAQVRDLEEKTRADLIRHIQAEGNSLKLVPETDADQRAAKAASLAQWQAALDKLQNTPPNGRLVVHISPNIKKWANTSADIEVRSGDTLVVPKTPNFVMVEGSVYNPTAVTYKPGRNAGWYLQQAGGPTNVASKKSIFLVRADGSVVGGRGGLFSGGALDAQVRPGDMLVVPEKAYSGTTRWKNTLEAAQLAYAVGIAIQVAKGF
jgi:protein involved in polysaccharide export with SLBB domain